jgi:hypothetical protein
MHATVVADLNLVRVTFPAKPVRSDLTQAGKKLAAGVAHTLVGKAQNVTRRGQVWTADYAPIRPGVSLTGETAPAAPAASPTGDDDRLAWLERELARVTALLAAQAGATAPAAAPVAPVSESTARIQAKIAASAALKCKVCRDLGVIRLTPRENGRWNFRSADGAAQATRKQPCTACQVAHTA